MNEANQRDGVVKVWSDGGGDKRVGIKKKSGTAKRMVGVLRTQP